MCRLLQYVMGLDSFDCMDSLEQARNRLLELVEILKALGWLLELDHRSDQDRHIFMKKEIQVCFLRILTTIL